MKTDITRREFGLTAAAAAIAAGRAAGPHDPAAQDAPPPQNAPQPTPPLFEISLAEWSLHRTLRRGELTNLDFPAFAQKRFDITAVEYVNQFFADKADDARYLNELELRVQEAGSTSLLIMVDGEGALGDADESRRDQAVENHHKWVRAAQKLGCHSIRVNAQSSGSYHEQMGRAADGLRALCEYGDEHGINIIVENHGGYSSHGRWLADTIAKVDHPRCGALPDFGNFRVHTEPHELWYDRYLGVHELMPFAKAISAKSHAFDENGDETSTDFEKMLAIVTAAGYRGHIGIEWEGDSLSEEEGILATRRLLDRVRETIAARVEPSGPGTR